MRGNYLIIEPMAKKTKLDSDLDNIVIRNRKLAKAPTLERDSEYNFDSSVEIISNKETLALTPLAATQTTALSRLAMILTGPHHQLRLRKGWSTSWNHLITLTTLLKDTRKLSLSPRMTLFLWKTKSLTSSTRR